MKYVIIEVPNEVGFSEVERIIKGQSILKKFDVEMDKKHPPVAKRRVSELKLDEEVTEVLKKFGIPAHIKGYRYIRLSLILSIKDSSFLDGVTKVLYPGVAKAFHTTSGRVERAIRHAIEVAWERADINELQQEFGSTIDPSRGKPTNSQFIAMIADMFRNVVVEK